MTSKPALPQYEAHVEHWFNDLPTEEKKSSTAYSLFFSDYTEQIYIL
jgi:hypothetical protein